MSLAHPFTLTFTLRWRCIAPEGRARPPGAAPGASAALRPGAVALGADDLTRPGLVFGAWVQVGDHHLHRLDLLVLGRDGTHLVCDLVSFHRHILAVDTARGNMTHSLQKLRGRELANTLTQRCGRRCPLLRGRGV